MAKKVIPLGTIGHVDHGKTIAISRANKQTVKPVIVPKPIQKVPIPVTRESFKTDEEYSAFMNFTKPMLMSKVPKMPFKTLGEYLKEYNLIMQKQSQLTATQRIVVKNVIHAEVRKGTITLTTQ
jgi:hypothetical protein